MKNSNFLHKLKLERKLELVETSNTISDSYAKKSRDCLQVAKLAFEEKYFENSIGEAYYSMYNSVLSLFYFCGIKCENHSAATIILKEIFHLEKLYKSFSYAKEERIDKQYYVTTEQENPISEDSAKELISLAEKFILDINFYKKNLKIIDLENIRVNFKKI